MNTCVGPPRTTPWLRRAVRRDEGAALVEFALVAPVFLLVIFGILEFGLAFKDYLTVTNTSRSSARVASAGGADVDADYAIIQSLSRESSAMSVGDIQRMVVYRASGPGDPVPASCAAGNSAAGVCNVYTVSDFQRPPAAWGCLSPTSLDGWWCPTSRKVAITAANGGPPDYVGVWVKARHNFITGLFGANLTFTDQTVMRIEPRRR